MSTISYTHNMQGVSRFIVSLKNYLMKHDKRLNELDALTRAANITYDFYEQNAADFSWRYHDDVRILDIAEFCAVIADKIQTGEARPYADDFQLYFSLHFINYQTERELKPELQKVFDLLDKLLKAEPNFTEKEQTTRARGFREAGYFWDIDGADYTYKPEPVKRTTYQRKEYSMMKGNTRLTGDALTAERIRQELKAKFPHTKFSVRVDHYSCINVTWTDGARVKEVEPLLTKYEAGRFDGMTDSYEVTNRDTERIQCDTVKYIFTRRELSPEREAAIKALAAQKHVPNDWGSFHPWQLDEAEQELNNKISA